jgi:FhaA, N-terminal domain/FHA domain
MGLQRFERRLERLVEGGFGKAFRSGLQPVEIGRRVVRELDSGRQLGVRGTVVPNHFVVRISDVDLVRFEGFHEALVAELSETVRDSARSSDYRFVGPVEVAIEADPRFGVGDLAVDASIVESEGGSAGALVLPDGRRVDLGEEPVRIGRLPDCAIALSDTQVSRHHAEVRRDERGFVVVDLGSLNGTTVNGVAVQDHALADGDVINIGETTIRYEES